jgi:hypothetical protein
LREGLARLGVDDANTLGDQLGALYESLESLARVHLRELLAVTLEKYEAREVATVRFRQAPTSERMER